MLKSKEVILTVNLRGTQAQHGSYSHLLVVGRDGKEINGLLTEKKPVFNQCTKVIHLSNEFVKDSLSSVPPELKNKISDKRWRSFSEEKRIGMAIYNYVNTIHPDNRHYSYELN